MLNFKPVYYSNFIMMNPSFKCFISCIVGLLSLQLVAQTGSLHGILKDEQGTPLIYANMGLFNATDSSLAKASNSNETGHFEFKDLQNGSYYLKSTYVGMEDFQLGGISIQNNQTQDLGVLKMNTTPINLKETTVSAKRSILEVKPDRLVFNVEGTINSIGSDALSLLRKAPSVTVDNNDNISLLGRSGVLVYLDGKRVPMSGQDLSNYLQNLPAEQIDRIDIITNPGAKYEAQGNAGIIDIRLKKDSNLGTNGTVNASYIQGKYPKYSASGTGNYRNKNLNLFGTLGAGQWIGFNIMKFQSYQNGLYLEEYNESRPDRKNYNYRLGTDYFLTKNQTIGILLNGFYNDGKNWGTNEITIGSANTPELVDSILIAKTVSKNPRNNQSFNLNYRFDDKKNKSLNIDLDYGFYNNTSKRDQVNTYYNAEDRDKLSELFNYFNTPSEIDILTLKLDYEHAAFKGKLGYGAKLSRVVTDNTYHVYDGKKENASINPFRSNRFNYDENVYAAYVSYNRMLSKKWTMNMGLRTEQTDATGDLIALLPELQEPPVILNYLSWFPSAGLNFNPSPQNSLGLNYSRRINRPDYNVLNPFNNQLSQLSFEKGNPYLSPEIVNNLELNYTLAYRFNFKLGYSLTTDQITRLIGPDDVDPRASFINWDNLATQKIWSFNASLPFQITKSWEAYFNLSGSHLDNQADYGNGAVVDLQAYTYSIFQQHSFSLPYGLKAEVSGYYSGPGIWGGVFVYESSWNLDAGIQKKFIQDKLNLKLSFSDIFYESGWEGVSVFDGLESYGNGRWDSRRINVNMSYRFGNDKVKSRKRTVGSEDEAGRVGGEGGN